MDLKLPGYEREVVEGLRARGLTERSLISIAVPGDASTCLRELDPEIRRGWSVPKARRDYTKQRCWAVPAFGALAGAASAACPAARPRQSARAASEALMAHWLLVTPAPASRPCTARAASSTSGRSTTPQKIARFEAMGVTA